MRLDQKQFEQIKHLLPRQRGNVQTDNYCFLCAVLHIAQDGNKWRALPPEFGKWNSVYRRARRWAANGVFERLFTAMQEARVVSVDIKALSLDSTSFKVHPGAHGALKKKGGSRSGRPGAAGAPGFIWFPRVRRAALQNAFPAASATTRRKGARP